MPWPVPASQKRAGRARRDRDEMFVLGVVLSCFRTDPDTACKPGTYTTNQALSVYSGLDHCTRRCTVLPSVGLTRCNARSQSAQGRVHRLTPIEHAPRPRGGYLTSGELDGTHRAAACHIPPGVPRMGCFCTASSGRLIRHSNHCKRFAVSQFAGLLCVELSKPCVYLSKTEPLFRSSSVP